MDITERKITKIAREAEKLVLLTLREKGVGTAEIDLIHALRHHPGCTQAALAELLHADKAAIARRTKNLEAKGYLVRKASPQRPPQPASVPHRESRKPEIFQGGDRGRILRVPDQMPCPPTRPPPLPATLHKLYTASKTESRAGFPHFKQATEGEDRNMQT